MRSGGVPAARRLSASLPSVGPMVLPAPVSISARTPSSSSRKAFTAISTGSPAFLPASRSASARSSPITTSSEVESTPSLTAVTAMSPIVLRVAVMADSAPSVNGYEPGTIWISSLS